MTKRVCKSDAIILGGHDISEWVRQLIYTARVGDIYTVELDIMQIHRGLRADRSPLRVENLRYRYPGGELSQPVTPMVGADYPAGEYNAEVYINDTPIHTHVRHLKWIEKTDDVTVVRVGLFADEDILTINGVHPWMKPTAATVA